MYGWIFRHLPGPLWARILWCLVLSAMAVLVLFELVFPLASRLSPFTTDVTLQGP